MRTPVAAAIIVTILLAAPVDAQTRVTRAASSTVRLEAGARAVPLTIEGQNMDSISSVRVLLNGRPATGVTAVIKQATAAQVVVELTAAAGVEPGNYTIELLAGRQRISVPSSMVSVDIAATRFRQTVERTPMPQRRPIPTVPAISATPATIVLGPRESGNVVLSGSNLDKLTSAHVVDGNGRLVYHVRAELQPGTATSRTVRLTVPDGPNQRGPFGTPMTIMVSGEPGSSTATPARVEVKATYDLYISSCRIEPLNTYGWYKGFISITNHGSNTIAASLPGRLTLVQYDSHPDMSGTTVILVPTGGLYLTPGQTWTYEIGSITFSPDREPKTLSLTLLPYPREDERNHANNERTCSVPPHTAKAPPVGQPDLVVSQVVVTPTSGPPSTEFVVSVTVRNHGNADVSFAASDFPAAVRCTIPDAFKSLRSLAAGATEQFTFPVTHPLPPGQKETICTVDTQSRVTESNENNNSRSATFTVTDPGGRVR